MASSPASRRLRLWARATQLLFAGVVAVWLLLGVAWGALQFWIVPRAEAWRPALEAVATRALGVRVTVGAIEAADRKSVV